MRSHVVDRSYVGGAFRFKHPIRQSISRAAKLAADQRFGKAGRKPKWGLGKIGTGDRAVAKG